MGSIGIISLTTRRNRRFHSICRTHIQLLRCGPLRRASLPTAATEVEPSSSDPLVGGLPRWRKDTDQGLDLGTWSRVLGLGVWSRGWDPSSSVCDVAPGLGRVVETRRLELLTLSLQRRCSTN